MTTAWLRDLEEKVQQASARLSEMRKKNGELEKRIQELEAELEAAPATEEAAAWAEERDDVRQRVEKLVDHLGELLEA